MSSFRNFAPKCINFISFAVIAVFCVSNVVLSQSLVKYLPGYDGELPFKLETGYMGVGGADEVQLFYYFIESERDPANDPLILWLNQGPGCSGLSSLLYEIGPLKVNTELWTTEQLPSLELNGNSWSKLANIIFIDQPVGTGFSYAMTSASYNTSDSEASARVYSFLRKWLVYHPEFATNSLYIGGDGYAGIIVPLVVQKILDGAEAEDQPAIRLQGYILGNPLTDDFIDKNARIEYGHRVNLLSDELLEDAKLYCYEDYVNVDPNNTFCRSTLRAIESCFQFLNKVEILEPLCSYASPRGKETEWDSRSKEAENMEYLRSLNVLPKLKCRAYFYLMSYMWANDKSVQEALNVREGTVKSWKRCTMIPFYTHDVTSTVSYHQNFTSTELRALIYTGDQDLSVTYVGTLQWIDSLGLPVFDQWRPWFLEGQIAGYTQKYTNDRNYRLTFATVKGAGNPASEYKLQQTLNMVDRWFSFYPI